MSKPLLPHQETSATLIQQVDQPDVQSEKLPVEDSKSEHTSTTDRHVEEGVVPHTPGTGPSVHDILAFLGISIMLIWPWIFFGVVWVKKGIQMNNHVAEVITRNPHATTYFITLICSVITMITGALFSLAIIRFAQELVTHRQPTEPFTLTVLLALRHQSWPWGKGVQDAKNLLNKKKWWPAVLLIVCVLTFPHLISSTTSLLTPAPFNRTVKLTGTELDFSSTASDCLAWFADNPINNTCDYHLYKGLYYTSCLGENQMVDVLEAGRGNILELVTDNTQSLTFSQLSADGLHFLGPMRGVLPIGPNGVPNFDTLARFPLSEPEIAAGIIPYDYTLNHQGLTSNVSCRYTSTYPFSFLPLDTIGRLLTYNLTGGCAGQGENDVLTNVVDIPTVNSENLLAYWACQSAPNVTSTASYTIYLAGLYNYEEGVGNITCTVNPIQAGIFPVTYHSTAGVFTTAPEPTTASPIGFSNLIYYALLGLADVVGEGQGFQSNPVAESVYTFGAKSFNVPPTRTDLYLRLFERMIQGMLEYETTYVRLIYQTVPNPPSSCIRAVNGTANYQVLGWFVTSANIGFLVPMTIINGAAFISLLLAVLLAKTGGYMFHPFHPRAVTHNDKADERDQVPDEWKHKVSFHPTSLLKEFFESQVKDNITDPITGFATQTAEQQVGDRLLSKITPSKGNK